MEQRELEMLTRPIGEINLSLVSYSNSFSHYSF